MKSKIFSKDFLKLLGLSLLIIAPLKVSFEYLSEKHEARSVSIVQSCDQSKTDRQNLINCSIEKNQIKITTTSWPRLNTEGFGSLSNGWFFPSVVIGLDAFSSPANLSSTIHHEVEVHGKQNLFLANLLDVLFGCNFELYLEREAYFSEIHQFKKHNLSSSELRTLLATIDMSYAYKEPSLFEVVVLPFVLAN